MIPTESKALAAVGGDKGLGGGWQVWVGNGSIVHKENPNEFNKMAKTFPSKIETLTDAKGGSNREREDSEKQVLLNILLLERGPGIIWEGAREGPEQSGDGNAKMSALFQINTDCTDASLPKGNGICSVIEFVNRDLGRQSNLALGTGREVSITALLSIEYEAKIGWVEIEEDGDWHALQLGVWQAVKIAVVFAVVMQASKNRTQVDELRPAKMLAKQNEGG